MNRPESIPNLESRQFTPAKVAWILNVSERTVQQWYLQGEIEHFRVGHVVRFSGAQLLSFILANTRRARPRAQTSPAVRVEVATEDWARIERLIEAAVEVRQKVEAV